MTGDLQRVLYIAEPIDQSDYGTWKESVNSMIQVAVNRGWLCYRPSTAWRLDPSVPIGNEIEAVNRNVLEQCGAVLAHCPAGVPSIGVPREIEWAVQYGLPVAVSTDRPTWSLADVETFPLGSVDRLRGWFDSIEEELKLGRVAAGPLYFLLEGGVLPTRANDGDAGYDLYVSEDTQIEPGEFVDVPCGIRVVLPGGTYARITGRSSTMRRRGLLVTEGIIDTGYRGPLFTGVRNLGEETVVVCRGDRLGQLVLHENVASQFRPEEIDRGLFDRIPGDSRGESGFGSTGT